MLKITDMEVYRPLTKSIVFNYRPYLLDIHGERSSSLGPTM